MGALTVYSRGAIVPTEEGILEAIRQTTNPPSTDSSDWELVGGGGGGGGIDGSIADQQVAFGSGTEIAGDDAFLFKSTPKQLSIGDNYALNQSNTPGIEIGSNSDGLGALLTLGSDDANTGAPQIIMASSNGTTETPEPNTDGNALAQIYFQGYDGVGFTRASSLSATVSGTVASGKVPGKLSFNVKGDDSSSVDYLVLDGKTKTTTINTVLKLTPAADPPASAVEGMIYADTDHHLYYYNGTTWKQLDN